MIFILFWFCIVLFILSLSVKWSKQEIAKAYGISKQTLRKLVNHYCPSSFLEHWSRVRKLNIISLLVLTSYLGAGGEEKVYSKNALLDECGIDYITMGGCIGLNLEKLNFKEDTYCSMDIFPPKVSSQIVEILG